MQRVILDQTEEKLRQVLVTFASEYSSKIGKEINLRITGGWVRDKLLGRPSHDIDIAIDNATGQEFALALQDWMSAKGLESHGVHTIARNPEKSKHLETATTKLMGLEIDLVNLRSEKYSADSRIPTIEFGTPYEDAMRRDATLNALFYNLQLQQVEDFTTRGLDDLKRGVLCTPLDPLETFRDDPLRVLRLIRFVAQLNFDLDAGVAEAMAKDEIRQDLARKVSRERVGVELDKLLSGRYALKGLTQLVNLGVHSAIFTFPEPFKVASGAIIPPLKNVLARLQTTERTLATFASDQNRSVLYLATMLEGWQDLEVLDHKTKPHAATFIAVKESVKLPTARANLVTRILKMATRAHELLESTDRTALGLFVRECNTDWKLVLEYATCKYDTSFQPLNDRIFRFELDEAYNVKPVLTGSDVMKLFPDRRAGSWVSKAVKQQIALQLENPNISRDEIKSIILETL